ncbi:MAG: multiubiquitin domain-containing protein [Hyphomicrobiaceae bacterium]
MPQDIDKRIEFEPDSGAGGGSHQSDSDQESCVSGRGHTVSVADESFAFSEVRFDDRKVTGSQIAEAVRAHPVEEYVIIQQLPTFELETIRPNELIDLGRPTRVFVIKGSGTDKFYVNGLSLEWPIKSLSGRAIKFLAGVDEDDELLLERDDAPDKIIGDDDEVRIGRAGVEHLKSRPPRGPITIVVDGEPYEAPRRIMTPNEIIRGATSKDPATHYLVQITKHERISYKDKGDEPIRLKKGLKFQVICTGPMTVSDPQHQTGVIAFMNGLRQLGFQPSQVKGHDNHVVFDYAVETGPYADKTYRLGLVVPNDFPMNAPTGPYVSPEVHPIKPDGPHPTGGVHKNQAKAFDRAAGGSWQYWSRPFPEWQNSKRSVAAYLSHIWNLWDSQ